MNLHLMFQAVVTGKLGGGLTDSLAWLLAHIPPDALTIAVIGLITFYLLRARRQLVIIREFTGRLEHVTGELSSVEKLEDVTRYGDDLKEIRPLLIELQELIVKPNRNIENSEAVLSTENVMNALHVDDAHLEHYPGIFTALGIAGTFVGILIALIPLGEADLAGESLVQDLLAGAGVAFLTSIFGIGSSLFFLERERTTVGNFRQKLHEFRLAIDNRLDRLTSEKILLRIDSNIETMADDIGNAITSQITETLQTMSEALDRSVQTAGSASETIVANVLGGIQETLQAFSGSAQKIESTSDRQLKLLEQFESTLESASKVADKLETLLRPLTKVSEDLVLAAEKMEDLPLALLEFKESHETFMKVVKQNVEELGKNWESERERLTANSEALREQLGLFEEAVAKGLQQSMEKFDDELSRAGQYVATWLERMHEDVGEFTTEVKGVQTTVHDTIAQLQGTLNELDQGVVGHVSGLNQASENLFNSLQGVLESTRQQAEELPEQLQQLLVDAERIYRETSELLPGKLETALKQLDEPLEKIAAMLEAQGKGFFARIVRS